MHSGFATPLEILERNPILELGWLEEFGTVVLVRDFGTTSGGIQPP